MGPGGKPAHKDYQPSANKGKRGSYQCHTSIAGCDYWVCVPASYSDDKPAGIHVFFHGQNGQGGAPNFGQWQKAFLEPFNLIGINMQYQDGDNAKDTPGKVAAAREAIGQTLADYKIIAGRNQKRSTALVTNVDFDKWGDYLFDGPLAMALLDRLVQGAIILKIKGRSYRAHGPKEGDKPA